jgi:protein gp37
VHKNRLDGPGKVKKPATVFVGSMCDMMGAWWHPSDIQAVIWACEKYSQHTFLWLTKNPSRYSRFNWPDNVYLGITVTKHLDLAQRAPLILDVPGVKRFISYEPMHNHLSTVEYFKPGNFVQVICGPENGPGKGPDLSQDEFEMQLHINLDCKAAGIDIYNKHDNSGSLYWPVKGL